VSARLATPTDENFSELHRGARLTLFGHSNNFEEFLLNIRCIAAADMGKNLTRIVITTNGCKVTGRVWKRLYSKKEK
jgi:hypothetical protein